jgi:hypothetical protein
VTLICLVAAGVAFIAAVQCSFWARQYVVTPDDFKLWHPDYPPVRTQALQRLHNLGFSEWNSRLNRTYRGAILLLLLGVTFALIPPGHIGWSRSVSVAIAALACVAEASWIAATWLLYGSPTMAYDDQPDTPRGDVRARWLRSWQPLRRVARMFVPLQRIQLNAEERSTGQSP